MYVILVQQLNNQKIGKKIKVLIITYNDLDTKKF